jgi:hypothetical protein
MQAILLAAFSASQLAAANRLMVEPRRVTAGERVEIVVRLEGSFATLDRVSLPTHNLRIISGPDTVSEFVWTGGRVSREKTFRWIARAEAAGQASAGPVVLTDRQGRREELGQVFVTVTSPDPSAWTPEQLLERFDTRQTLFVLPEVSRRQVVTGQQVVVTWYLYAATSIRGHRIAELPQLDDFWVEDATLPAAAASSVVVNGRPMRRSPIRRLALYPLREGVLQIAPLTATVEVLRPLSSRPAPWQPFEAGATEILRESPPVEIRVVAPPAGAAVTGRNRLTCSPPETSAAGPVAFDVSLRGHGNLRSAAPPSFASEPQAAIEIEDLGVSVDRRGEQIEMDRRWRFVLFPASAGELRIPSLELSSFDPQAGRLEQLRCEAALVQVAAGMQLPDAGTDDGVAEDRSATVRLTTRHFNYLLFGLALAVPAVYAARRIRRRRFAEVDQVMTAESPKERRRLLDHLLEQRAGRSGTELLGERSELGERYRDVVSLLDILDKNRSHAGESEDDLRGRLGELFREALRSPKSARR